MPTLGRSADQLAGVFSRLLHARGAHQNTVEDLGPYFDLPLEQAFPEPPPLRAPSVTRSWVDRAVGSSTLSWRSGHEPLCPKYRRRHYDDYPENLTAWARWVRPAGARRRTALVYVHGWLEPGSWAEESTLFRIWGRELDVDLVHVTLPFHGRRTPRRSLFPGELFWTADLVRSIEGVRQAVFDARSIAGWLRGEGYERVGVTGLSLGGAISMLVGCVTPTPDFVAPMMAHLKLHEAVETAPILWRVKRDLDRWGVGSERREEIFRRLGWSESVPRLAPTRQLWVEARDDVYIAPEVVERQWREWGGPPIEWIAGGHMTFPLAVPAITQRLRRFLQELPSGAP